MDYAEQTKAVLEVLREYLQGPGQYVYETYLRQATVQGWAMMIGGATVVILCAVVSLLLRRAWVKNEVDSSTGEEMGYHLGWAFSAVLAIVASNFVGSGILHILNPAYYAIIELMRAVR